MAQIGRLKGRTGLRLDLNMKPLSSSTKESPNAVSLKPSSSTGTNWREDLQRIVSKNRSLSFLPQEEPTPVPTNDYVDLKADDFENIQKLGEGAAGTVWKVRYKPTGLVMAKKTITVDPDPQLQRQILRELSFLKDCGSPHIVAFHGAFLDDGETTIAICMEYCEGGSLEDIYKRARDMQGVIGETVLAKIAEAVCKGLTYLHSQKVIHRDIKPSNILMTRSGEIKLCDLGVSGELINSLAQTFTGTQYYMAPERIKGGTYSVRSDIWSLGLTIIEVAQNRPALPPPGQPNLSIFELLDYIVHQPMPSVGEDRSEACRDFVAKCLIKDPSERPGPEMMLEHKFIKEWADPSKNLAPWLKEVWDWP
ncbi:kinase-like domain-containing protein [Radiomyces spectabilis]|uniref:kinase-like domain-containing protein n=1 Tax=Radiomyces spectabilis TaxID=64574 RepID=UPI00221E5163|nr:kinase-like domain-containing protein [Radiomyces spectabilis]KAI8370454.1 kinase-like domain-containing protein [Radiomyces spectabilis]